MGAFVQKQNQSQKGNSTDLAKSRKMTPKPTKDEHPILRLQRTIGNQAVLRMLRSQEQGIPPADIVAPADRSGQEAERTVPQGDQMREVASKGVAGPTASLPHLDAIRRSFGKHDVSGVEAHTGPQATAANQAIGAVGYAAGNRVAFADTPDLHTAAHEAAHVIQQRGDIQLKDGVGESGVRYEQHADVVADAVVRGQSVEPLLDRVTPSGAGAPALQRAAEARPTVQMQPAKSKSPQAPALQNVDQYEKWRRRTETPYGTYTYWEGGEADELPLLAEALRTNREAKSDYTALQEQLGKLGIIEKRIDKVARPPLDFTGGISRSATKDAVRQAETAEGSKNAVTTLALLLKDFKARLWDAGMEVRLSNRSLEAVEKRERATKLRARGEEQEKRLDLASTLCGAAIEGVVGVVTGGASQVLKPAYDAITAFMKFFRENDLIAEAESLEREARAIELEDAAARYSKALDNLKHVGSMLADAGAVSGEIVKDYERQRERAEGEFDRTSRGDFRFGDFAQGIEMADRALELGRKTLDSSSKAGYSATHLTMFLDRKHGGQSWKIIAAIGADNRKWLEASFSAIDHARPLGETLRGMRMAAHEALVTAPGTGKPRAQGSPASPRRPAP